MVINSIVTTNATAVNRQDNNLRINTQREQHHREETAVEKSPAVITNFSKAALEASKAAVVPEKPVKASPPENDTKPENSPSNIPTQEKLSAPDSQAPLQPRINITV